jgi:hypothetical protein
MGVKFSISAFSSLMVSNGGLAASLLLAVLASVFHIGPVAGLAMFLFLLGAVSRLWGRFSVHRMDVEIRADNLRMYRGDRAEISFLIRNRKALPLIWLELVLEEPRRRCVMPEGGFCLHERRVEEETGVAFKPALEKKFAFIMGRQTLRWNSVFLARRRGVYPIREATLRSGDGFGLTQAEKTFSVEGIPTLVVYPDIVPVQIHSFLRPQWEYATGAKGHMEDITVIRGIRRYQTNDSWKKINWRMAARQQQLMVNLHETVLPKTAHFILDGESFCGLSGDFSELEEVLSILASLFLRLDEASLFCGLSLPASKIMKAVTLPAGEGTQAADLLFYLSAYECLAAPDPEKSPDPQNPVYFPSSFHWGEIRQAALFSGRVYYVAYSTAAIKAENLSQVSDPSRLTLLTWTEETQEEALAFGLPSLCLNSIKRGA